MAADPRIVRHRSEFGEWEAVHRAPDGRLAPYVRRMSGWWERTSFTRRREVPHAGAVLIVNIGNRLNVSEPGSPHRLQSFHSFFAGLHTSYVITESNGSGGGMQVDFTPLGAYRFTGVPAHELADRVLPLHQVIGLGGRLLTERLEETPDWEGRFDLLEAAILARLNRAPEVSEGIGWAWARLEAEHGLVEISGLAAQLGWSPRQMIDGFRRELGLPPKQLARVIRFNRAAGMLSSGDAPFAQVAAECGYYDQSHFSREFREFAGSTPSQFRERLVPESGGVLDADPGLGLAV